MRIQSIQSINQHKCSGAQRKTAYSGGHDLREVQFKSGSCMGVVVAAIVATADVDKVRVSPSIIK